MEVSTSPNVANPITHSAHVYYERAANNAVLKSFICSRMLCAILDRSCRGTPAPLSTRFRPNPRR